MVHGIAYSAPSRRKGVSSFSSMSDAPDHESIADDRSTRPFMPTRSCTRLACTMTESGRLPAWAAVVNFVMKSAFGIDSSLSFSPGYASAKPFVTASKPRRSSSPVKWFQ